MVASRQVEIPYYRAVGRQRGRGFGALAQVIGRTAIPFLRKYIVPAAKRVGADLLEFAAPEIGEVISGRKTFKSAAKSVGKKTLRKQLGEGEGQGSRRRTGSRRELAYGRKGAVGVRQGNRRELAEGSRRRTVGRTVSRKELAYGRKGAISGRESQTYGRQAGKKQRRIIPTKTTRQSSRSRRDIFANISR